LHFLLFVEFVDEFVLVSDLIIQISNLMVFSRFVLISLFNDED